MQVKVGKLNTPLTIPHSGTIVAWTVELSQPTGRPDRLLRQVRGRRIRGRHRDPQEHQGPRLRARRAEPARAAAALLRQEGAVRAGQHDPRAEGRARRADRCRRGRRRWRVHRGETTSWRASRPGTSCNSATEASTETAQETAGVGCPVRLPLPDGAAALLGDADLHAVAAVGRGAACRRRQARLESGGAVGGPEPGAGLRRCQRAVGLDLPGPGPSQGAVVPSPCRG